MCQTYLEDFWKDQCLSPTPRILDLAGEGGAWESAFLTSAQMTLILLVWGPHVRIIFKQIKGKWWKKNILIFCHPYQSNIFKEIFKTSGGISASNGIIEGSLLIWLPFTTISNSCVSEVPSICCWTKKILSNLSLRQVYFGTLEKFRSSKNQSDSLLFQTHLAKPSCLGLASISSPLIWPKWTVLMTWKLSNRVRRRKS